MRCGVVYKFKRDKKINGTLFYCFEYFDVLRSVTDAKMYIVDISYADLVFVKRLFAEKYTTTTDGIVAIRTTDLYRLQLDHIVVLDVHTFTCCKEFFTNTIHCYSNDTHDMFRYKNNRSVVYYGSYPYQRYDVHSILKLNFGIFRPLAEQGTSVFIASGTPDIILNKQDTWKRMYDKPLIFKKPADGSGNIFDSIDTVHYVHTVLDKNNRIIPEAFFYKKHIVIENDPYDKIDSVQLRYDDIQANGLDKYTLDVNDVMIQACLK